MLCRTCVRPHQRTVPISPGRHMPYPPCYIRSTVSQSLAAAFKLSVAVERWSPVGPLVQALAFLPVALLAAVCSSDCCNSSIIYQCACLWVCLIYCPQSQHQGASQTLGVNRSPKNHTKLLTRVLKSNQLDVLLLQLQTAAALQTAQLPTICSSEVSPPTSGAVNLYRAHGSKFGRFLLSGARGACSPNKNRLHRCTDADTDLCGLHHTRQPSCHPWALYQATSLLVITPTPTCYVW